MKSWTAILALLGTYWSHVSAQPAADSLRRLGDWGLTVRAARQPPNGAEVTTIRIGAAADRAGIRSGDRITRANGRVIRTNSDIDDYLLRFRERDSIAVDITRDGTQRTLRLSLPPMPLEQFDHATVTHDAATSPAGDRVRLIMTRPTSVVAGPLPVVFFVGWLSCDSVEYPFGETDGFGSVIRRVIERSGYATVRVDKPGVGDSEGPPCRRLDFRRELAAYRAAFDVMARFPLIDSSRVFVLGLSNGGGFAPLVVNGGAVRGYVVSGAWGRSWYEHMIEHERRRLMRTAIAPAEVDASVKTFTEFYASLLTRKMTPGAILAEHPTWRTLWYDADDGMYGRPAAFYQQLQNLNIAETWQRANAPALVLRGSADTVMSRGDTEAIADILNKVHPGTATYREIDGADHLLMRGDTFADEVIPLMLDWMQRHL